MLRRHDRNWGITGSGWRRERRFLGLWWGVEWREQRWAPLMSEWEKTWFVGWTSGRLALTTVRQVYKDGQEPRIVRGWK